MFNSAIVKAFLTKTNTTFLLCSWGALCHSAVPATPVQGLSSAPSSAQASTKPSKPSIFWIHTFFNSRVYLSFQKTISFVPLMPVPLECCALRETGGPIHHIQPFGPSHCKKKQITHFKCRKLSKADVFLICESWDTHTPSHACSKGTPRHTPGAPIPPLLQQHPL